MFVFPERRKLTFSEFAQNLDAFRARQATAKSKCDDQKIIEDPEHPCRISALRAFEGISPRTQASVELSEFNVKVINPHLCHKYTPSHIAVGCSLCANLFASSRLEQTDEACIDNSSVESSILDSTSSTCNTHNSSGVFYISEQNNSFRSEFQSFWNDIDQDIDWASESFGCNPDAVNLWIGDERAVSSMHKDPYENIYAVITGEKHFTLFPPTDIHWTCESTFPVSQFQEVSPSVWEVVPDPHKSSTVWIPVDFESPSDLSRFPRANRLAPHAIRCRVQAGEILFLPSMWFHRVAQFSANHESVIAVNFWYDMAFDSRFAYLNLLSSFSKMLLDDRPKDNDGLDEKK